MVNGKKSKTKQHKEGAAMTICINLRVTSFGQIVFEMGKPTPPIESHEPVPVREGARYREPLETASLLYEVQYQEELTNYGQPITSVDAAGLIVL